MSSFVQVPIQSRTCPHPPVSASLRRSDGVEVAQQVEEGPHTCSCPTISPAKVGRSNGSQLRRKTKSGKATGFQCNQADPKPEFQRHVELVHEAMATRAPAGNPLRFGHNGAGLGDFPANRWSRNLPQTESQITILASLSIKITILKMQSPTALFTKYACCAYVWTVLPPIFVHFWVYVEGLMDHKSKLTYTYVVLS